MRLEKTFHVRPLSLRSPILVPLALIFDPAKDGHASIEIFMPTRCCWAFRNTEVYEAGTPWASQCRKCGNVCGRQGDFIMAAPIKPKGVINITKLLDDFFVEVKHSPVPLLETKYVAEDLAVQLQEIAQQYLNQNLLGKLEL